MEDNKKPTFNVLFARGVVEQDYLQFLKNVFADYNVVGIVKESNKSLPNIINLVLFTGGEDVSPSLYSEKIGKYTHVKKDRDTKEYDLFHNIYYNTPKLGICRGAQFLTVAAGGKLIQHVEGHKGTLDSISLNDGTIIEIPSDHHQMMYPYNLSEDRYEIIGHSTYFKSSVYLNGENENIILPNNFLEPEIVYYNEYRSLAIQSHPEWISDTSNISFKYIMNLIRSKVLKEN